MRPTAVTSSRPFSSASPPAPPRRTEETFGPTPAVTKITDSDETVALTNAGSYGAGSAVFSRIPTWAVCLIRLSPPRCNTRGGSGSVAPAGRPTAQAGARTAQNIACSPTARS
ncbi:aldehyde dehydrogenase family protein [Streptomyces sp. NBC_01142]|uniref:aldehyde dehydrogenase family protein n=1 Tax=Streptomyces sp. NBC_01142 TaxID=2975865 RepID=UPI00338F970B